MGREIDRVFAFAYEGTKATAVGVKNLVLRNTGASLKPKRLVFMTTDRCNSRCGHCYIWKQRPTDTPLTAQQLRNVLSDPLFGNVGYVLNTGGEPTLRKGLEDIIFAEHEALPKTTIQLSTNGLLPDRAVTVVKAALEHGIRVDIGTSIDGIGEKHDQIRGVKGSFEKVDYLLHELVSLRDRYGDRIRISAQMTLFDLNLDSVEEVRAYAKNMNIDLLEGWYNEASFYSNTGRHSTNAADKLIQVIESQPKSPLQQEHLRALRGKSIKFTCFAMYTFCVLKCNGDIVPCLNLWDVKAGNVRENSPSTIWHSDEAKKARKAVKDCSGCLNSWGMGWSFGASFYPILLFHLKHPQILARKLRP